MAVPSYKPYSAVKAALMSFMGSLSREWAPVGVRVNVVSPGEVYYPGGFWERMRQEEPGLYADAVRRNIMGRMADPADVARAGLVTDLIRQFHLLPDCIRTGQPGQLRERWQLLVGDSQFQVVTAETVQIPAAVGHVQVGVPAVGPAFQQVDPGCREARQRAGHGVQPGMRADPGGSGEGQTRARPANEVTLRPVFLRHHVDHHAPGAVPVVTAAVEDAGPALVEHPDAPASESVTGLPAVTVGRSGIRAGPCPVSGPRQPGRAFRAQVESRDQGCDGAVAYCATPDARAVSHIV